MKAYVCVTYGAQIEYLDSFLFPTYVVTRINVNVTPYMGCVMKVLYVNYIFLSRWRHKAQSARPSRRVITVVKGLNAGNLVQWWILMLCGLTLWYIMHVIRM